MDEWRELLSEVASHLAGRAVEVDFADPPTAGAWGECYMLASRAIIDLSPGLRYQPEKMLKVFLHECSHARFHLPSQARALAPVPLPGSYVMGEWARAKARPLEDRAEAAAARWVALADSEMARRGWTLPDNEPMLAVKLRLIALKYAPEAKE